MTLKILIKESSRRSITSQHSGPHLDTLTPSYSCVSNRHAPSTVDRGRKYDSHHFKKILSDQLNHTQWLFASPAGFIDRGCCRRSRSARGRLLRKLSNPC
ncbi:Uncharacterized protein HZ326_27320 [Fusarium oxysporum f. sp. albedinis]|nr:Uncharacterized protein HZ326_27320 [Fusarium oxysporum f. sp. albedinis]